MQLNFDAEFKFLWRAHDLSELAVQFWLSFDSGSLLPHQINFYTKQMFYPFFRFDSIN